MTEVYPISINDAKAFCRQWHYSNIFPPHCIVNLAYDDDKGLAGVSLWGWGVRPVHTIAKIFPSLTSKDYYELNRLCLRDDCPRNSESHFIAQTISYIKTHYPNILLLYTWADGIRGKVGYIYQASNWLYGGFIVTEIYLTKEGEPVHPRLMITRYGTRSKTKCDELGLCKVRGKQYRYIYFLCNRKTKQRLLDESTIKWGLPYPKDKDNEWWIDNQHCEKPNITKSGKFRNKEFV